MTASLPTTSAPAPARFPVLLFLAIVVSAIVVLVGGSGAWVYGRRGHDMLARALVTVIPFPAAIVDGRPVWLRHVFAETNGFVSWSQKRPAAEATQPNWNTIAADVLLRKIETAKLQALARERGIVVTEAEVEAEYGKKTAEVDAMRKELGWSEKEFRQEVVAVYLLEQKLRQTLGPDALERELMSNEGVWRLWAVE